MLDVVRLSLACSYTVCWLLPITVLTVVRLSYMCCLPRLRVRLTPLTPRSSATRPGTAWGMGYVLRPRYCTIERYLSQYSCT